MVRILKSDEDFYKAAQVTSYAFATDCGRFETRVENHKNWPESRATGYFDGDVLHAVMLSTPFTVYLWGVPVRMDGVGSFAALPEFRHGGSVAALLKESARRSAAEGVPLSMLNPFSYGFYKKYGWEYAYDAEKVKLPPEQFAHLAKFGDLRPAIPEDMPHIRRLYEQYAKRYNFMAARDEAAWKKFEEKKRLGDPAQGKGREYCYIRKELDGYLTFEMKEGESKVEFVFASPAAVRGLAGFFGRHNSPYINLDFQTPHASLFRSLAADPRAVEVISWPGFMLRVTNFKALAEAIPARENGKLNVELADDVVSENCGAFGLTFKDGRCEAGPAEPGPALKLDVYGAARLACGAKSAEALLGEGLIRGDVEAARVWDRVVPRSRVFLNFGF